jgi:hypothetical protein
LNHAINELDFDNCLQSGRHSDPGPQHRALVRPANPDGATGCLEFMMRHPIGGVVDWGETVSDWQTALNSPLMNRNIPKDDRELMQRALDRCEALRRDHAQGADEKKAEVRKPRRATVGPCQCSGQTLLGAHNAAP